MLHHEPQSMVSQQSPELRDNVLHSHISHKLRKKNLSTYIYK